MELTFRPVTVSEEAEKYNLRANEEVMIYGFVVRIVSNLNLLDFFERFKEYVEVNNMAVYSSFDFTRWLMEEERLAVQDMSTVINLETLPKFWDFQDEWLEEQHRKNLKRA